MSGIIGESKGPVDTNSYTSDVATPLAMTYTCASLRMLARRRLTHSSKLFKTDSMLSAASSHRLLFAARAGGLSRA